MVQNLHAIFALQKMQRLDIIDLVRYFPNEATAIPGLHACSNMARLYPGLAMRDIRR